MVISDCYCMEPLGAARGDKLFRVCFPLLVGVGTISVPVDVARGVDLKVAAVDVGSFVHPIVFVKL